MTKVAREEGSKCRSAQQVRLKREGTKVGKRRKTPFTGPCYIYPHLQGYFGLDGYVPLNRLWMSALSLFSFTI